MCIRDRSTRPPARLRVRQNDRCSERSARVSPTYISRRSSSIVPASTDSLPQASDRQRRWRRLGRRKPHALPGEGDVGPRAPQSQRIVGRQRHPAERPRPAAARREFESHRQRDVGRDVGGDVGAFVRAEVHGVPRQRAARERQAERQRQDAWLPDAWRARLVAIVPTPTLRCRARVRGFPSSRRSQPSRPSHGRTVSQRQGAAANRASYTDVLAEVGVATVRRASSAPVATSMTTSCCA